MKAENLQTLWHQLPARELAALVKDTRARSLSLLNDLDDDQWVGPYLPIVNPPLWEIGHVAFFYEAFLLQPLDKRPPLIENGGPLFNSFVIPHQERWKAPLPNRKETVAYTERVLEAVLGRLDAGANGREITPRETYLYLLSVLHEDMHCEAFTWTRQTHGYAAPPVSWDPASVPSLPGGGPLPGDVEVPGGNYLLGAMKDQPYVFDNEKWAHPVEVAPFSIAKAPVTNAEFAQFVEDGGYQREALWDHEGWRWRMETQAAAPVYWRGEAGHWEQRSFHRWTPLEPHHPVIHVNWYEAEAYCKWAGRRLPSEAEWEMAASTATSDNGNSLGQLKRLYPWGNEAPDAARTNLDGVHQGTVDVGAFPQSDSAFGCRQMIGNVWEWTSDPFYPFPGYLLDLPYKEYSAPWFGYRKVLKGGAWPTRARMTRNTYRNFFTPDRQDVFAGFRTCAPRA